MEARAVHDEHDAQHTIIVVHLLRIGTSSLNRAVVYPCPIDAGRRSLTHDRAQSVRSRRSRHRHFTEVDFLFLLPVTARNVWMRHSKNRNNSHSQNPAPTTYRPNTRSMGIPVAIDGPRLSANSSARSDAQATQALQNATTGAM